jgi:hypothetical protein
MRISVRKGDPGYKLDAFKHEVFLDGEKLQRCFTADEETGQAWVYAIDKQGKLIIDNYGRKSKERILTGKVEIRKCG